MFEHLCISVRFLDGEFHGRGDNGDAAGEAALAFRNPEPLAPGAPEGEFRQRAGDVRLECGVETVVQGIHHAVELDNGPEVARSQVVEWLKITLVNSQ